MTNAIDEKTTNDSVSTDADYSSVRPWEKWLRQPGWTSWNPRSDVTQWEIHWPEGFDSVTRFCVTEWNPGTFEAKWVGHRDRCVPFNNLDDAKKWCERAWRRVIAALFEVS